MTRFSNAPTVETSMLDEFIKQAAANPLLSRDDERQLCERMKAGGRDGEKARDELINRHLRLAVYGARKFAGTGLPHEELVQEGNIGLIKAANKFEPERGFRFMTYATWWVRSTISEYARDCGRVIRVSAKKMELISKMKRAIVDLTKANARPPSDIEVAKKLGVTVEEVHLLMELSHEPVSINIKIGENSETELGDMLADASAINPEAKLVEDQMVERVTDALSGLKDRERDVVIRRFGLGSGVIQTLEEIANDYGLTRERVRQIEAKALEKLGKGPNARLLKSLL